MIAYSLLLSAWYPGALAAEPTVDPEVEAALEAALADEAARFAHCGPTEARVTAWLEDDGGVGAWRYATDTERCVVYALKGFAFPAPGRPIAIELHYVPEQGVSMAVQAITTLEPLDRSTIDARISEDMSKIRRCYLKVLKQDRSVAGRLVVAFTIGTNGKVTEAGTKSSDLSDPRVEECVVERFRQLRFPEPKGGGIWKVTYPFLFTPQ